MEPGKQFKPYTLILEKGNLANPTERKVVRKRFATHEEAAAHGEEHAPTARGGALTWPKLSDKFIEHKDYNQGLFDGPNRYGAIHKKDVNKHDW